MAQSSLGCALAFALSTSAARADGYVGDMSISAGNPGDYANSGATVWTGANAYATVSNPAGASILNEGAASGTVTANGGVVRNAPGATWNGDLAVGANVPGAEVVNQGQWNGALNNAGGTVDNTGTATSGNNAAGVLTNEGTVTGGLVNGAQATNSGTIGGAVVNASQFVNNATGVVSGGLADSGTTTNNGKIAGGVTETGAFTNNASGVVGGGFALNGGSVANNGEVDGGATVSAGAFTDNAIVNGGASVTGSKATLTVNGTLNGPTTVAAGSLVVNAAGVVSGSVANASNLTNSGVIQGSVVNSGALVNTGTIDGYVHQTAGQTTNSGTIASGGVFLVGALFNNGAIGGDVKIGAKASMIDNGSVAGLTVNQGDFVENATGALKGVFVNKGQATVNGLVAGGLINKGQLVVNAAGRVQNGLVTAGGSSQNAGLVTGGAIVTAGLLTSTGEIDGGLYDAGLVEASGVLSGTITIKGKLVVGDGTPNGAKLTIAPGSVVSGVVTMPVNLSTGQSDFLSAKGASLVNAKLDLTGVLTNPTGAYWGALSLSDTPIALTDAAKQALLAASGPLYHYTDPFGTGIVQTINPGLGVTASQVTLAAIAAFTDALAPAPADFERAPADPTPNLGGGSAWSRGFGAELAISGENNAGTGPAFDATRLQSKLAGGEMGFEYGLHNIQNSGVSLRVGVEGGEARGLVADSAGSGASSLVTLPFAGAYAELSGLGFTGRFDARYAHVDMSLTNAPLAVFGQGQRAAGMIYTGEAAYRIPLGAFYVEPSAGLTSARLAIADEATNVGDLAFSDARMTFGHVGLKVGGDFVSGALNWRPYAIANVSREWLSGGAISVPKGPTIQPTGLDAFEQVGLGLSATLDHTGLSGFAQASYAFGPKIAGLAATGGLRFDF